MLHTCKQIILIKKKQLWHFLLYKQMSDIFSGIAWCYGDNDFIIQTFNFTVCWDAARM